MKRKLSNYVEVVNIDNFYALFNKLNGCLLIFPTHNIAVSNNDYYLVDFAEKEYDFLEDNMFFVNDKSVFDMVKEYCMEGKDATTVRFTISVTEKCNIKCEYCYQNGWNRDTVITDIELISKAKSVIDKIISDAPNLKNLDISFIGGEPLLRKDLILKIQSFLESNEEIKSKQINIKYSIDTNGTLLTKDFIQTFSNLFVSVPLTTKMDHNIMRDNSFDSVFNNLNNCKDLFDNEKYILVLRYNMHHNNITSFEEFLDLIIDSDIKCRVNVQNIMNTNINKFINNISDEDFQYAYVQDIIPLLHKKGFNPKILPYYGINRNCFVGNTLNSKLYSNGNMTLCDAFSKESMQLISKELLLPNMCVHCYDFPYCGGVKPCEQISCSGVYNFKSIELLKIKKYIELHDCCL